MRIMFTTYTEYNNDSISELELSDAIENLLRRNDIFLIGDLIKHIEEDTLGDIKNMGATKLKAIKNALFNFELCVSPDPVQFILDCVRLS